MKCVNIGDNYYEDFRLTNDYGVKCNSNEYKL